MIDLKIVMQKTLISTNTTNSFTTTFGIAHALTSTVFAMAQVLKMVTLSRLNVRLSLIFVTYRLLD